MPASLHTPHGRACTSHDTYNPTHTRAHHRSEDTKEYTELCSRHQHSLRQSRAGPHKRAQRTAPHVAFPPTTWSSVQANPLRPIALPPHPPPAHSFRRPITLPVLPRAPAPVYLRGGVLGMPRAAGPTSHPLTFWANCNELFVSMWCSADDETLTNMSVFDLPRSEFESRWVSRELR